MGTKGREIIKIDIQQLIKLLNKAYADEWLAYYQYWLGAKVVQGTMKSEVMAELTQHAADELRHAGLLADRIQQLGGTPLLSPKDWQENCNCKYEPPVDPSAHTLVVQNIKGEQCAIETYAKLLEEVKDKDMVTFFIIEEILRDEVEHEDDLENILEDMRLLYARIKEP